MIRFKSEKLLVLQSAHDFRWILERIKMSQKLISKPRFQGNFMMCLESRIGSLGVGSIELWSIECTNFEFAKFEKICEQENILNL